MERLEARSTQQSVSGWRSWPISTIAAGGCILFTITDIGTRALSFLLELNSTTQTVVVALGAAAVAVPVGFYHSLPQHKRPDSELYIMTLVGPLLYTAYRVTCIIAELSNIPGWAIVPFAGGLVGLTDSESKSKSESMRMCAIFGTTYYLIIQATIWVGNALLETRVGQLGIVGAASAAVTGAVALCCFRVMRGAGR